MCWLNIGGGKEDDGVLAVGGFCETKIEDCKTGSNSWEPSTGDILRACSRLSRCSSCLCEEIGLPGADLESELLLLVAHAPGILFVKELCETALIYILSASSWLKICDCARSSSPIGVEISSSSSLSLR
jgi:hypothetical protein